MSDSLRSAGILSIGDELLLGRVVDTNASWLAGRLAALGIRPVEQRSLGDDVVRLGEAIRELSRRCDVLIATGGLGPTEDDVTREAFAAACGCVLQPDPRSLEQIRAFYARLGRPMPDANRRQALRPACGEAIENPCGTAPGLRVPVGRCLCYALPGVPFEMRDMFERSVRPELAARAAGRVVRTRRVHCCGSGEAAIGEKLADLMSPGRTPRVGTTASLGIITVHIVAEAATADEADQLLDASESQVRERLGPLVFGTDDETLASAVGRRLVERGETLAVAESCTGGLLGALITDVPGASRYFTGGVISYANEAKRDLLGVPQDVLDTHGAVSEPVAEAMAAGVRARLKADRALAITGIAGPTGGTPTKPVGLIYVGLSGPDGTRVQMLRFSPDQPRDVIRLRSCHAALNLLRKALHDTPRG